jgi:glycosyltransferase involved in cell wall biosynthesis
MVADALAVIVIVSSCVQLGYCCFFFLRLYSTRAGVVQEMWKADRNSEFYPESGVSVIICARNEALNLMRTLPLVLAQNYYSKSGGRLFEVIVVDDQSVDNTASLLSKFAEKHQHLRIVTISDNEPRTLPGKKFALSKGVAEAAHDYIVMIDADCEPASRLWLFYMALPLDNGKDIVAGYGGLTAFPGLLNLFIRAETVHTFLQYYTYSLAGIPYMAVGRNLACKKYLIEYARAQPIWKTTPSGDDDLLIRLTATADNLVVNTAPMSFTYSAPKRTWKAWVHQKQRHFSTGKLYKKSVQILLAGYAFSHAGCWAGIILTTTVWHGESLQRCAVFFFAFRSIFLWMQLSAAAFTTRERRLGFFWPLFDIGWLIYNSIFAPFIFWKNKQQWK